MSVTTQNDWDLPKFDVGFFVSMVPKVVNPNTRTTHVEVMKEVTKSHKIHGVIYRHIYHTNWTHVDKYATHGSYKHVKKMMKTKKTKHHPPAFLRCSSSYARKCSREWQFPSSWLFPRDFFWLARQLSCEHDLKFNTYYIYKYGSWPIMIIWRSQTQVSKMIARMRKSDYSKPAQTPSWPSSLPPRLPAPEISVLLSYWRVSGHRCPSNKAGYSTPVSGGWAVFMGPRWPGPGFPNPRFHFLKIFHCLIFRVGFDLNLLLGIILDTWPWCNLDQQLCVKPAPAFQPEAGHNKSPWASDIDSNQLQKLAIDFHPMSVYNKIWIIDLQIQCLKPCFWGQNQ